MPDVPALTKYKTRNRMVKTLLYLSLVIIQGTALMAQTSNLIISGDMENGGWADVPRNTDLASTFEAGQGMDGSKAMVSVINDMGGDTYYIIRCEDVFHLDQNALITVSFQAKSTVEGLRLQPWIQESDNLEWMNFGDAYLSTNWKQYSFTAVISTATSDNYKVKFRGYNTGTISIDNVRIGPDEYGGVPQSDIYDVSIDQDDSLRRLNVFRHACPVYSPGYQGMSTKDQTPLGIFAGRTINWAKFTVDDPVTVQVRITDTGKVPVSGQTVRILPSRYGVTPTVNGDLITFTIREPAQYSVEVGENGYKNGLLLFADPPETDIPDTADPSYLVLNAATAADVSDIPASFTGIYFKKGIHDIGVFHVPFHIKNVYFEDGSWVYGTLVMDGNPGVRIFGRGVLSSARLNYRVSHCVEAINGSDNITLEGLVIADPKYFAVRLIGTHNTVNYTKVVGGWVWNCDGIAAYAGSTVSKCFVWANDDAIKVYRDSITWSDIVVWQLDNGGIIQMSWGGAVGGSTSRGVRLSRIDVLHAEWDKPGFNSALLCDVGNHYKSPGKSDLQENWLIEDVVTENPIPKVFKITPDPYSHDHIHGLVMKNWNVQMPMNTSFVNEIKGEDPDEFLSGFVFDSVVFNHQLLTNTNYITNGDMESGGWVAVPGNTNLIVRLDPETGVDSSAGLKSVVTDLGGDDSYVIQDNEKFHLSLGNTVTIRFMAKANISGAKLIPFIQNADNLDTLLFGEASLTRDWAGYSFTRTIDHDLSGHYQLKLRGFNLNAVMYIDDVQIGPPDWLTVTGMQTQYLETPVFLPEAENPDTYVPVNIPGKIIGIYPNPVSDILFITGSKPSARYMVYSATGNLLLAGKGTSIVVSSLNPGLYILVLDEDHTMKFIKQ